MKASVQKLVGRLEAEQVLKDYYLNKIASFKYPGYKVVYGKVDNIAIEGMEVIIHMNETRYTCSFECLQECLKLTTNGDTH